MILTRVAVALTLAGVALLTACTTPSVGTVMISWREEAKDPVGHRVLHQGTTLFPDQSSWDQWVQNLPADMSEARTDELEDVILEDSVAVVAVWNRCTETSQVLHKGHGALEFQVIEDKPQTTCAWSPRRVEVWTVPLDAMGVGREDVTLTD